MLLSFSHAAVLPIYTSAISSASYVRSTTCHFMKNNIFIQNRYFIYIYIFPFHSI